MPKPYSLQTSQVQLLELLYTYRFGTRQLLADALNRQNSSGFHQKIETLRKNDYIDRRYEASYRLQAMPAAYYLTAHGIRTLQLSGTKQLISERSMNQAKRDERVSQTFIDHTLALFSIALELQKLSPKARVFTKRQMGAYTYFPKQAPDLLLSIASESTAIEPKRTFIDFIPNTTPYFVVLQKLTQYARFFESGGWYAVSRTTPQIMLLLENEKRLTIFETKLRNSLFKRGIDNLQVHVTSR